jgi:hypothetical protein
MKTTTKKHKIKVLWALLCQTASVDQQSNNISIFNVLEEMNLNQTPISSPQLAGLVEVIDLPEKTRVNTNFCLVVMLEKEGGFGTVTSPKIKIKISDPDGEVVAENEFPLMPGSPKDTRIRAVMNFDGMIVQKSGKYTYDVYTKSGAEVYEKEFATSVEVKIHP